MFCFFFNIILKKKGFHDTIFLSTCGVGGRLGWLVIPSMSHSQLLLISLTLTYLAHARVTMSSHQGCVLLVGVACSTLACYIIWQLKGRKGIFGSVQDILLKLRHNFMAFFSLPTPINLSLSLLSLSLSQSNFLRLHSTHKIGYPSFVVVQPAYIQFFFSSLSTWMRIL